MNSNFAAWVSSTAFHLSLSVAQIRAVLAVKQFGPLHASLIDPMTSFALERRGVFERRQDASLILTRAGVSLADLLREAGYTAEEPVIRRNGAATLSGQGDSQREKEVMRLLQSGLRATSIAKELKIRRETVWRIKKRVESRRGVGSGLVS